MLKRCSLGGILGLLFGLAILGAYIWVSMASRVPALPAANANNIISATPEFNRSYANPVVTSLEMGRNSMQATCLARVSFRVNRTSNTVDGSAFFKYWEHEWHLTALPYGVPPNVTVIKLVIEGFSK